MTHLSNLTKLAAVMVVAGMTLSAHALSITPASLPQFTGNQTSQSQIDVAIAPIIGGASFQYKQNVGGAELGPLAGSYETTFSNSASDPSDALIHYVGGQNVGSPAWLLVKDGNQSPAWYLFNLTALAWNGTDDLVLTGFWPAQGAISHVSLYGTAVPDGAATAVLLGMGLLGLVTLSRKTGKRHAAV